ncbi:MAG: hypothetical protein I8H76_07880 [Burkholderiales bacterium]|nr:hypothetical protein [Burkholderiales bacterium]MBH2017795.1 hypothetical protein [Burkholderiales bacterium]
MTQAYAKKPIAYWLALAASATLGGSWLGYLAYLSGATITKQSVYMGAITFYAAVLLALSGLSLVVLAGSVGYLARNRHHQTKSAIFLGALAIVTSVIVFVITRPLISNAT